MASSEREDPLKSVDAESVRQKDALFRNEFSRAVTADDTRPNFTYNVAPSAAHTSIKSDFKKNKYSILGEYNSWRVRRTATSGERKRGRQVTGLEPRAGPRIRCWVKHPHPSAS